MKPNTQPSPSHESPDRTAPRRYLLTLLAVVTIGVGVWSWSSGLSADPPRYYAALGQAVLTDPANVVYHARNEVLFDNADPFNYGRWVVFQRSLTSLATWAWASIAGMSYARANAAALLLNLIALDLILLGLAGRHRPWTLWTVAAVWLVNATMIVYGRQPFLENGLLVLASLSFLLYSRWGDRLWGIALSAAAIAAATLMGKLFGVLLLPALLIALFIQGGTNRRQNLLVAFGSFAVSFAALLLILYGGKLGTAFAYIGEQAYGLRGFPEGLTSPWAFVEHLMIFGASNRIYFLTPDLLVFLVIGGLALVLFAPWRSRPLPRTTGYAVAWAICVVGGLMPLNYSPLRYALLLLPAIFVGCFGLLDWLLSENRLPVPRPGWVRSVFLALLVWYAVIHVLGMTFARLQLSPRLITWTTLPAAALITWGVNRMIRTMQPTVSRRTIVITIAALLVLSLASNGYRIVQTQFERRSHNLVDDSRELAMILGPDAVLSGPYGPVLAMETNLKSFIHMFGVSQPAPDLFRREPITHLLVDEANYVEAVKAYPVLGQVPAIASYWIAGWQVKLYDISDRFGNPDASRYRPTEFELAVKALQQGRVDEAQTHLDAYLRSHPLTKSPGMLLTELQMQRREKPQALETIAQLANDYPNDFFVQLQRARLNYLAGLTTDDRTALQTAETAFRDCLKIDPTKAGTISQVRQRVEQMTGRP